MPVRSTATPGETDRITRQTNWPFITASPWLQCTAEGSPLQNSGRMNSAASSAIHQIRQTQLCNNTCKCAPTYYPEEHKLAHTPDSLAQGKGCYVENTTYNDEEGL